MGFNEKLTKTVEILLHLSEYLFAITLIKSLLSGLLFSAIGWNAVAQSNRISWEYNYDHFGIKNGLPSSETYQVHQDKSGILWILTDRGVVKYDGFEFYTYTHENGLSDNINFRVVEDHHGGVWFVGQNGLLSVFQNGKMQPYKYNHKIAKRFTIAKNTTAYIHVNKDRSLVYRAMHKDMIRISDLGEVKVLSTKLRGDSGYLFEFEKEWMFFKKRNASGLLDNYLVKDGKKTFVCKEEYNMFPRFKRFKGHQFMMIMGNGLHLFDSNHFQPLADTASVIGLDADADFLYVGLYKNGVKKYRFNPKTKMLTLVEHYLPAYSVSSVCRDRNGTLWFTTLENGIFAIYDEAFSQLYINGVNFEEDIRFVNGNKQKVIITQYVGKWQQLYAPYLLKDAGKILHGYGLLPFKDGFAFEKNVVDWSDWKDVDASYPFNPIYSEGLSIFGSKYEGNSLVRSKSGVLSNLDVTALYKSGVDGQLLWFYLVPGKKLFVLRDKGLYSVGIRDGKLFIQSKKFLSNRIKHLKFNKKWGLIGVSGDGELFRISLLNDRLEKLIVRANLGKQIATAYFDEQDQLWLAGQKGLFRLTNRGNEAIVRTFLNRSLFSSAEIKDIYAYKNLVYLATKFGMQKVDVMSVKKPAGDCPLNLFFITAFANNREVQANKVYPANTDLIKIRLSNKHLDKQLTYRYRFGNDQTWIKTDKGEIIVNNPAAGDFTLQVSSLNKYDQWSKPKVLTVFTIEKVIFLRWYFILLYIGLIILLFYGILKYTVRAASRKNELLNRMMELERMALSAQMNPHFIFNSLNSIHSFLLYEENENAEKYLLRFAKLIRQTLANSRVSYITVSEEYETLNNYVLLEKMRFKNNFSYRIDCNFKELPQHACVPPMLIQPYVENAIIHGLSKRTSDAELFIGFYREGELLKVVIRDNGIGYNESIKNKRDNGHKSYGTQITEERLKSFQEKSKEGFGVSINPTNKTDGEFPGTEVILTIPIPV